MDLQRINFNNEWHEALDKIVGAYNIPEYDGVYKSWNKTRVRQKIYHYVSRWIWGRLYAFFSFGNNHDSAREHVVFYVWDKIMDELHSQRIGASELTGKWIRWIYDLGPPNSNESTDILFTNLERLLILQYGYYYVHDTFHSDSALSNWWLVGGAKTMIKTMEKLGIVNDIGEAHSDVANTQEDIIKADEDFINEINKQQNLPWASHIGKYEMQLKKYGKTNSVICILKSYQLNKKH